ncbi:hypothetical protein GN956_G3311 [Arapaima gigas]
MDQVDSSGFYWSNCKSRDVDKYCRNLPKMNAPLCLKHKHTIQGSDLKLQWTMAPILEQISYLSEQEIN